MIRKVSNFNKTLFTALLFMGLCPAIYTTIRTSFLGSIPGEWSYSIAGQLSWVNLLYEIIDETIVLPLFFLLGSSNDKQKFSNRIKSGILVSFGIYIFMALLIFVFVKQMLFSMATDPSIIDESATYIRIEAVANIAGILYRFLCVAIIATGMEKFVYMITAVKMLLSIIFDILFVSSLPVSLHLGVNGIGYSNFLVNLFLTFFAGSVLIKNGYIDIKQSVTFKWMKDFARIGGISGAESFVRNVAYILMVSRMVNTVGEQGIYWVANNFIWGWLLLPVNALGELIKQEVSKDKENIKRHSNTYFKVTVFIVFLWLVLIPLYKPFMTHIFKFGEVDKLYDLVMILLGFYIFYAFQNIFDATFYGRGKTEYMLLEAIITNTVYYGGMYIAYRTGLWTPTLMGIAIMFGVGNVFDTTISYIAYRIFLKREKI